MERNTGTHEKPKKSYAQRYNKKMKESGAIPDWISLLCFLLVFICVMVILQKGVFPEYKVFAGIVGIISFIIGVIGAIESTVIMQEIEEKDKKET